MEKITTDKRDNQYIMKYFLGVDYDITNGEISCSDVIKTGIRQYFKPYDSDDKRNCKKRCILEIVFLEQELIYFENVIQIIDNTINDICTELRTVDEIKNKYFKQLLPNN